MKTFLPLLSCALALLGLLAGCSKSDQPAPASAPAPAKADAARPVPVVRGVIQDVLKDRGSLLIKHEEIAGVMPGMTMAFKVDAATLAAAQKGQTINAILVQRGMEFSLTEIKLGATPAK